MKVKLRRAITVGILVTLASPLVAVAAAAPAAAAAHPCNLPGAAKPGSVYVRSFSSCNVCIAQATHDTQVIGRYFYCTWNPSRNHADEHYIIR